MQCPLNSATSDKHNIANNLVGMCVICRRANVSAHMHILGVPTMLQRLPTSKLHITSCAHARFRCAHARFCMHMYARADMPKDLVSEGIIVCSCTPGRIRHQLMAAFGTSSLPPLDFGDTKYAVIVWPICNHIRSTTHVPECKSSGPQHSTSV